MFANPSGHGGLADLDPTRQALPEAIQLTADTLRAWRTAGYRLSERRVAQWLYLIVRGDREAAVYKIVGPLFRDQGACYEGLRVA